MADPCETAKADYDKAHREVKEQFEELKLWAAAAGISIVAFLGCLAAAVALAGITIVEGATIVFLPAAVVTGILDLLVILLGFLSALAFLISLFLRRLSRVFPCIDS